MVTTLAGSSCGYVDGTGTAAKFYKPAAVAVSPDGLIVVVADDSNHCIRAIALATGVVTTLAGSGSAGDVDGTGTNAQFSRPAGIALAPNGATVLIGDTENQRTRSMALAVQG